ncbi:hypothetical protein NKH00_19775, partial [Mesorhizobium sp. M1405]
MTAQPTAVALALKLIDEGVRDGDCESASRISTVLTTGSHNRLSMLVRSANLQTTGNKNYSLGAIMNSIGSAIAKGLFLAGLFISAGSALAAKSDDGFAAFWTKFKAAVGKSDQKAVSQMIKYPIYYNDQRQVD